MKKTLEELFKQHQDFARDKFPLSTYDSSLRGLEREIKEVELARMDYRVIDDSENRKALGLEYIDCFMYLLDSMNRLGFEAKEISELFEEKLKINKEREWKINSDGSYSHVK